MHLEAGRLRKNWTDNIRQGLKATGMYLKETQEHCADRED